MEQPQASFRIEPWWVRASYLVAAGIAAAGDWLFVSAGGPNPAWTVYLGTYLGFAGLLALVGGLAPSGPAQAAGRGVATGAAGSFVLLGAASIGVLFIPLAGWLALATAGGDRMQRWRVVTVSGMGLAMYAPIAGLLLVFHR